MNRTKLTEVITVLAGMATVASGMWSIYLSNTKNPMREESFGVHAVIADELAGRIELTDEQIDQLAALKIRSIQSLCPLVHQLCSDVRQLKAMKIVPNRDVSVLRKLEQRVLKDRELIMEQDIENHQSASHILGS
jgi:hypothetical protein